MADVFTVDLVGFAELPSLILGYTGKMLDGIGVAAEGAANDALEVANTLCPVRTGYLRSRNAIAPIAVSQAEHVYALVNDAPYALYVILGTYKMRARDFFTPAYVYGRQRLMERLAELGI